MNLDSTSKRLNYGMYASIGSFLTSKVSNLPAKSCLRNIEEVCKEHQLSDRLKYEQKITQVENISCNQKFLHLRDAVSSVSGLASLLSEKSIRVMLTPYALYGRG